MPGKPTIPRACERCGTPFLTWPYKLREGKGRFCSQSCGAHVSHPRVATPTADLFWPRTQKTDSCWLTTGGHHRFGYGLMGVYVDGVGWRTIGMHVVAWWLATGRWPAKGEMVCHDCPGGDNPACVRNDTPGVYEADGRIFHRVGHLWLGDQAANMADKVAKGRQPRGATHGMFGKPNLSARGERSYRTRLTPDDVRFIRAQRANGTPLKTLADQYGVTVQSINLIVKRKNWAHVV